ncbi:MAG: hypothetical protein IPM20_09610 [Gammaproteobacteria bacterium]|nr:hypothetical protein [Gammaproteobacteria bacterium]
MKRFGATVVLSCLLALAACGPSEIDLKARGMVERYYQLIQQGNFADAVRFYPESERQLQLDALEQHRQTLGTLQSFQISAEEQNTVYSGKFYIFTVDTQYEQTQALETLTMKTWVSSNDSLSIVSQLVDAD